MMILKPFYLLVDAYAINHMEVFSTFVRVTRNIEPLQTYLRVTSRTETLMEVSARKESTKYEIQGMETCSMKMGLEKFQKTAHK